MSTTVVERSQIKAREIARKAWANKNNQSQGVVLRCDNCRRHWKNNGRPSEEKPPDFPSDFSGNCPTCNGFMREAIPL